MKTNTKKFSSIDYEKIANFYKILSNSKRVQITFILLDGEKSFTELLKILKIRKANLSQHINILKQMNFVKTRQVGRNIFCSIGNQNIMHCAHIFKDHWKSLGLKCK